eukprot:5468124-Amphidinium_carterae.2
MEICFLQGKDACNLAWWHPWAGEEVISHALLEAHFSFHVQVVKPLKAQLSSPATKSCQQILTFLSINIY